MINIFLALLIGYLVGSIPTAIWMGKITKKIDIREHGSGNAGATNAIRVLGWKVGILVLIVDMFKGFIPVFYLPQYFPYPELGDLYPLIIGVFTIIGHIFPVFAGFKGGKGVGTAAGAFAALIPLSFSIALILFILVVSLFRYVSLGSLLGAISIIISVPFMDYLEIQKVDNSVIYILIVLCLFIIYMHRGNIVRLIKGEENKLKFEGKS